MTIENALKWGHLWWLLSLDFAAEFRVELWLDRLELGSLEYIRSNIDIIEDLPTYGSDPRPKAFRRLHGYEERFGRQALEYLSWWKRCVFIAGGSDRASEFLWRMATYSPASSLVDPTIATVLEFVRSECSNRDDRDEEKARSLALSKWDQQAIEAEQSSREDVLNSIRGIASTNAFACSWHSNVTVKGIVFLGEVFSAVSRIAPSSELQFEPETIPFPSSWEFDLPPKVLV